MNFGLSEEQRLLQQTVRSFVENECPVTHLREVFEGDADFDEKLWNGLVEMGIGGLLVSEEHGGAGMEVLDLALVAEVLGAGAVPAPFLGHALATVAIVEAGSDAQKEKWLPALASGERLATVALGEPGNRWDPSEYRADLKDGRLTGVKSFVTNASRADAIVVGLADGKLALVDRGAEGVKVTPVNCADRTQRSHSVEFVNAPAELLSVPAANRVRDAGLVLLAADALGGAWKLVEMSVEYAKTREQFGVTIGHFQALKHQLANMAIEVEPSRGLYWYAAHAFDHVPEESERYAALAKAHLTDVYMQVARDAVEAHGGIGFTWECDVQIWFKRAMFDRALLGQPALHRERAARLAGW